MSFRFDLESHLERQRDFSLKTFGPGERTKGVIDHIRKELDEIEATPDDLSEWMIFRSDLRTFCCMECEERE